VTVSLLSLYCLFTVSLPSFLLSLYCLFTVSFLSLRCLFTVYSLSIHCLFTASSLSLHCLFTVYSLSIYCLFNWLFTIYLLSFSTTVPLGCPFDCPAPRVSASTTPLDYFLDCPPRLSSRLSVDPHSPPPTHTHPRLHRSTTIPLDFVFRLTRSTDPSAVYRSCFKPALTLHACSHPSPS
jgi:hypothetical protein